MIGVSVIVILRWCLIVGTKIILEFVHKIRFIRKKSSRNQSENRVEKVDQKSCVTEKHGLQLKLWTARDLSVNMTATWQFLVPVINIFNLYLSNYFKMLTHDCI